MTATVPLAAGGQTPLRNRDFSAFAAPVGGTVASITVAATNGASHTLTSVVGSVANLDTVAAHSASVEVFDGATQLWGPADLFAGIAPSASTATVDRLIISPLNISVTLSTVLVVQFVANPNANFFERLSVTWYDTAII